MCAISLFQTSAIVEERLHFTQQTKIRSFRCCYWKETTYLFQNTWRIAMVWPEVYIFSISFLMTIMASITGKKKLLNPALMLFLQLCHRTRSIFRSLISRGRKITEADSSNNRFVSSFIQLESCNTSQAYDHFLKSELWGCVACRSALWNTRLYSGMLSNVCVDTRPSVLRLKRYV